MTLLCLRECIPGPKAKATMSIYEQTKLDVILKYIVKNSAFHQLSKLNFLSHFPG